jgi:hypothetical protein
MKRAPRIHPRHSRRVLAVIIAAVAGLLVLIEPLPKGIVLVPLTAEHGIDAGDLPALALLLAAGWLAIR